jgi:hypothetical protein
MSRRGPRSTGPPQDGRVVQACTIRRTDLHVAGDLRYSKVPIITGHEALGERDIPHRFRPHARGLDADRF